MSTAFLPPSTHPHLHHHARRRYHHHHQPLQTRPSPTSQPPNPLHKPSPTAALSREFAVTAFSALTITLSNLPPLPQTALANTIHYQHHHQQQQQQRQHTTYPALVVSNLPSPPPTSASLGVATAPIHDYTPSHSAYHAPAQRAPALSPHDRDAVDEARREFMLAARLITAVLLGAMLGVERRATALNLGVRSITLLTLSAALCSVMFTSFAPASLALSLWATVAPAAAVALAGVLSGAGLFLVAKSRRKPPLEMSAMSALVGLVVTMGGACGAGLSLVTAACYLAAVGVMRASARKPAHVVGRDREFRVHTSEAWNGESSMAFRIGSMDTHRRTRVVVEAPTCVPQDPRLDPRLLEDAL